MKKFIMSLFLVATQSVFSQTLEKTLPIQIDKKADCIEVVDEINKSLNLLILEKLNTKLIRINDQFSIIDSLSTARPDKKFNRLFGYSFDKQNCFIYWNSKNKGELGLQTFDYIHRTTSFSTLKFELDNEVILYSYLKEGKFFVISCLKGDNLLFIRTLNGSTVEKHTIDFTGKPFFNYEGKRVSLSELFASSNSIQAPYTLQRIALETPPSLVLAAMPKKIYVEDNELRFTFDNYDAGTQIIIVNTNDYSFNQKLVTQPYFPKPESVYYFSHPTSSFYFNHRYIQLKSSPSELIITIKDEDGLELKSFKIEQDKEIPFRTSDIIQENGSIKDTRILSKSNQLLRKINNLNPATSLYLKDGNIVMILGGVSQIQQNGSVLMGGMFGVSGALLAMAFSSYSNENFNSYANRKVVYTSGLFDENFNPINDYVKKTGFDRMRAFSTEKTILNPALFSLNSTFYLGGFIKGEVGYSIYSFKD